MAFILVDGSFTADLSAPLLGGGAASGMEGSTAELRGD
jgi:hypothetical protein